MDRRRPLHIAALDDLVFPEGARLGTTSVQHPVSDRTSDVRIPTTARPLHTYVIGRTGSGKTEHAQKPRPA